MLGTSIVVRGRDCEGLLSGVRRKYAAHVDPGIASPTIAVDIEKLREGWRISLDGKHATFLFENSWPAFENLLRLLIIRSRPDLVFLHASCVSLDGNAALFVGASTSGKSTLATYFYNCGLDLVADDLTAIALEDAVAQPYHTRVQLRPHSQILAEEHGWRTPQAHECHKAAAFPTIRSLFCLNTDKTRQKGTTRANASEGFAEWKTMLDLCGCPVKNQRQRPSKQTIVRTPEYFKREAEISSAKSSAALRFLMNHLHTPEAPLHALLSKSEKFLAKVNTYELQVGTIESTANLVRSALEKDRV